MLGSWLETLPQAELAAVLASRRDVLTAPTPRDVSELADRLQHTNSVANAVRQLSAPNLQAIVALLALGSQRTPETLIDFLDDPSGDSARHEQDVADALADLRTRALVWPGPDGRLHLPGALRRLLPDPLGLGPAARALLQRARHRRAAAHPVGTAPAARSDEKRDGDRHRRLPERRPGGP